MGALHEQVPPQVNVTSNAELAEPGVALLLEIDRAYREKAAAGELTRIAPRLHNPRHRSWLPVWHTERDGFEFSVLFSNTARAHCLGRTHDWVVIVAAHGREDFKYTVVTEHDGPLKGLRVVRGREGDCRAYYRHRPTVPRSELRHWAHGIAERL